MQLWHCALPGPVVVPEGPLAEVPEAPGALAGFCPLSTPSPPLVVPDAEHATTATPSPATNAPTNHPVCRRTAEEFALAMLHRDSRSSVAESAVSLALSSGGMFSGTRSDHDGMQFDAVWPRSGNFHARAPSTPTCPARRPRPCVTSFQCFEASSGNRSHASPKLSASTSAWAVPSSPRGGLKTSGQSSCASGTPSPSRSVADVPSG